jgi:hypothetical protein
MGRSLGSFLLVVGVVLGSLAAADSKRAYRELELVPGTAHPEQHLHADVRRPAPAPASASPLLPAGTPLEAERIEELLEAGVTRVRVRHPARSTERVVVGEAALGRVLAHPCLLPDESEELKADRPVTPDIKVRAALAGVELPIRVEERAGGKKLEFLSSAVQLPLAVRAGEYVTPRVLERLEAARVESIEASIPPEFHWGEWRHRYSFVLAVILTLCGVMLLRRRSTAAGSEEALEEYSAWVGHFDALERGVMALAARADELDAQALHQGLDPLLIGPAYAFLEGRETLRSRFGGRAYTRVMGPYALAERQLHRAWSAAVDGVHSEAATCLRASLPALAETRAELPELPSPSR